MVSLILCYERNIRTKEIICFIYMFMDGFRLMVFNAIFSNISIILVEEPMSIRENYRPVSSHLQALSDNVVSSTPRNE